MNYSVFRELPDDFNAKVEVAGCFCHCQGKLLFVKRHPERPQGNTWGVPAGKMEQEENPRMTVIREVFEEVGLLIDDATLVYLGPLYCRLPHIDYIFHMFKKDFFSEPQLHLALNEHLESRWVLIDDALSLPLIAGGIEALHFYKENCI